MKLASNWRVHLSTEPLATQSHIINKVSKYVARQLASNWCVCIYTCRQSLHGVAVGEDVEQEELGGGGGGGKWLLRDFSDILL